MGKIKKEVLTYMNKVKKMLDNSDLYNDVDLLALDMLKYNYQQYIEANEILELEGLILTSDRGNKVVHPALKISKDAQINLIKIMEKFGLTARDRTKLPKLANELEISPLEEFINNANKGMEVR